VHELNVLGRLKRRPTATKTAVPKRKRVAGPAAG
jgi:hypothetical protein